MSSTEGEFKSNYIPHDILQEYLIDRLAMVGLECEQYGTDGDRGYKENPSSGYGPDLKVFADGDLCGYVEVKSKRLERNGDEWIGRLDKSHFEEYLYGNDHDFDGAKEEDVPVIIYFGLIDDETIIRDGFIPVKDEDQVQEGFRNGSDIVVTLERDDFRNLTWLLYKLGIQ